jgi:hypothetical protein
VMRNGGGAAQRRCDTMACAVDAIRTWGRKQWTAVGTGLAVGVAVAVAQCYLLAVAGRLHWYAIALIGYVALFLVVAQVISCAVTWDARCLVVCNRRIRAQVATRRGYTVHVHHYSIGLLVPFFPTHHPFSSVMQVRCTATVSHQTGTASGERLLSGVATITPPSVRMIPAGSVLGHQRGGILTVGA